MWATCRVCVLILLSCVFDPASAQQNIEIKVEKLEQTIIALERRVEALEGQLRQRSAPPPIALDKLNWRKLQRGMTEGEVEKLLGSPARVDAMTAFTLWHYGDRRGQVTFEARSRTVHAWSEP